MKCMGILESLKLLWTNLEVLMQYFFRNFSFPGGELRPISGKLIQAQLPKMDGFSRNRPASFLEIIKSASG